MPSIQHASYSPEGRTKGELLANWQGEINPGDALSIQFEPAPPLGAYSLELRAPEFTSDSLSPWVDLIGYDAVVTLPGLRLVSSVALGESPWQPAAVKEVRWSSAIAPTIALDFTLVLHIDFNRREVMQIYQADAVRPGHHPEADLFHGPWLSLTWWGVIRPTSGDFTIE